MARKKRKYQEAGPINEDEIQDLGLIDKIRNIFQRRQKWDNIGTEMGEDGKAVVTFDRFGNERKIKQKGPKGKLKIKYNPDGTVKKRVLTKGLRRIVDKPGRDSKKSEMNRIRNIQDRIRSERNPEVIEWIRQHMPTLFED
jgi:hypothetical protein|tara:strand:- start:3155 stop:3577 length:423 start_codon:yes stop_codon:yes gene_type:complete